MSALPPKADIVRQGGNVRFVPKADVLRCCRTGVIRHLGGAGKERWRHVNANRKPNWPGTRSERQRSAVCEGKVPEETIECPLIRDTATVGEISRKHGNTLIRTLRKTYGPGFATGYKDDAKLSDVLHKLDEISLGHLIRDHEGRKLEQICRS